MRDTSPIVKSGGCTNAAGLNHSSGPWLDTCWSTPGTTSTCSACTTPPVLLNSGVKYIGSPLATVPVPLTDQPSIT